MSTLLAERTPATPPPPPGVPPPAPSPAPPYQQAAEPRGAEKRREPRYSTCDTAEVALLDLPGVHVAGVVRDVSKNGLRVELDLPVSAGSRLKITLRRRAIVFAVARYCRRVGAAYQVGTEIESAYYPSRATTTLLRLDASDFDTESCHLARSIIHHHTSFLIGNPDQFQGRLSPVDNGPI